MPSSFALDELYSVSDLHLGGPPGGQIFNQGGRLAGLIDLLQARPKGRQVALVLNGDICDFLAEEGAAYLSPDQAVPMIERIFRDPAFAPVWQALSRFVKTPGRLLVLALGNHDVELALPRVQERLLQELCGDDRAARDRVVTAMDGQGFSCTVGRARVFCSHGNEVDPWNLVDYEALARIAESQRRGQPPPAWDPNAGTQLVIDVMNALKRRFPFVDLLKPETKLVPQTLFALDPSSVSALKNLGEILYRRARGTARSGFLSGGEPGADDLQRRDEFTRDLIAPGWRGHAGPALTEADVLRQMEADFKAGLRPTQVCGPPGQNDMLGMGQLLWDRITGSRTPQEALRLAMKDWLTGDETYEITTSDDTFTRMDGKVEASVDFVLAGHTHLMRALPRKSGAGMYYNSGTWIRLIRLTDKQLGDEAAFAPVYAALTAGTMAALDEAPGLVQQRPSVVRIVSEEAGAAGDLALVQLARGKVTLEPVPQSRHVRS